MLTFRDYGEPTLNPGRFVELDKDVKGIPRELKVRGITAAQDEEMRKKYGEEQLVDNGWGRRKQRVHSEEDSRAIIRERAEWAWLDCRNFSVEIGDAAAADFYAKQLGQTVEPGTVVLLDGKLTTAIKHRLFALNYAFALWLSQCSDEINGRVQMKESILTKNS